MNVLEVNNIKRRYKNGRGVSEISMELEEGGIYGLLGANGSGKTTIMKIISGLTKKDEGNVKIFGNDIDEDIATALSKVGVLIETPALYEYLSAEKNLEIAAKFYDSVTQDDIKDILLKVGLLKYQTGKKDLVRHYSLGMKQRLGIALALISKPGFVILDEPFNGLDIDGMVEMRNIIKHEAMENKTSFLISSHLSHELELICTKVGVIHEGRQISVASMDEVRKSYPSLEDYYISCAEKADRLAEEERKGGAL